MHQKDADGMPNSVDPDQTASSEAVWSWSALFAETYLSQYIEFVRYNLSINKLTFCRGADSSLHKLVQYSGSSPPALLSSLFLDITGSLLDLHTGTIAPTSAKIVKAIWSILLYWHTGEWMDNFHIYSPFNSISFISGQWEGDNELCAMESCIPLGRFLPPVGLEPRTTGSAGQHLT